MADDQVKIVDSVDGSAAVRLDLNDTTTWLTTYESDFSPSKLVRALSSNAMRDGGWVSVASKPLRPMKLVLESLASSADASELQTQKLTRELRRADGENFLKWQPAGATNAVFFPMYQSDVDVREVPGPANLRRYEAQVLVGPYAVGLPVTSSVTLQFDPASGSANPCYFDVTSVKGDVPTPLFMKTSDSDIQNRGMMLAVRSRGNPANLPWYRQAEALGTGLNTTTAGGDATASGSSYARCTFASPTMTSRLDGDFPGSGTASVDWAGTYRLIVRVRKSSATDDINVQYQVSGTGIGGDEVATQQTTSWHLLDLGLVEFPVLSTGKRQGWGAAYPPAGTSIFIQAERNSGAGTLDFDWVGLVPADECFATLLTTENFFGTRSMVIDGVNSAVFTLSSTNEIIPDAIGFATFDGRLPHVDPHAANGSRVWVIPGFELPAPAVSGSAVFDVQYWPLYEYLRPAST